jgi:cytochrome b
MSTIRVWDLPTRLFHWSLVILVVGMIVTGNIGGQAMVWHFRMGYAILTLLLFRLVWGFVGGYWSRFAQFIYSPSTVLRYLRGQSEPSHHVGHNPLGSGSVFALLLILLAQVSTGLFSDDDIAFSGPLTTLVTNATVKTATFLHKEVFKLVLILLVVLHLGAIVYYRKKKGTDLVTPMIKGDKQVKADLPSSRDTTVSRIGALALFALCALTVRWIIGLGGTL